MNGEGNGTPLQYFCLESPMTEEPGKLQSMGSLESDMTERLHFHFSLSCIGEGNGNPLQCSCLENPRDREVWWAAISGVAQSRTRLKWLSKKKKRHENLNFLHNKKRSMIKRQTTNQDKNICNQHPRKNASFPQVHVSELVLFGF